MADYTILPYYLHNNSPARRDEAHDRERALIIRGVDGGRMRQHQVVVQNPERSRICALFRTIMNAVQVFFERYPVYVEGRLQGVFDPPL